MDQLWLKQYQEGVPHEIDLGGYSSLADIFGKACRQFKNNPAYTQMNCTISFDELNILSEQFACYLQQSGFKKGARLAIMLPNVLQYPIALFAALRAGLVVVNTNPLYTADELVHQINDSGAEGLVVLANFAHTVEKALPRMPALKHVFVTELADIFPTFKRVIVNAVVRYLKKMVPAYQLPQAISFRQALQQGQNGTLKPVELTPDDLAFLQYTGGTTGVAKGAMLSHGNLISNVQQASAWLASIKPGASDLIVTALPLYHIFSLTANCLTFMTTGTHNLLITNPRDIPRFIQEIKNVKFSFITGVNTLFNALLNHPDFEHIDFSKLKIALAGGMALQQSTALRWKEKTRSNLLEAYGLTETSPAITINPLSLKEYNGSIGLPLPSTDISIRNDEGNEVPLGETGELCVKGPQVMKGYWQRDDETALVFCPDGFLRTGDIAKVDEQGFVYLVDRKKDMILVSGFNVYPNEVEQVINMMPGVVEVGVVSTNDDNTGEKVKACVVKSDPDLTEQDIIAHCRAHLTAYKIPKVVQFYDELPKTNVGKILRRALR